MKELNFNEMMKEELLSLANYKPKKAFNGIIIVPTGELHDSGYMCMKFILIKNYEIVGVMGGYSDVIHINGIGGGGKKLDQENPKGYGWRIDCLPKSACLRLFSDQDCELDDFIGSDFIFYVKENK